MGTHLPLLAKRYRYLGLIGEGTSAQARAKIPLQSLLAVANTLLNCTECSDLPQVLLAQDMLHPKQELIAIKVLKRHYSYVGQKARFPSSKSAAVYLSSK